MHKFTLTLIAFLLLMLTISAQTSQDDFAIGPPADLTQLNKLTLWSTQYYIHKFTSGGSIPIVLADGTPTGLYADTCNFCDASLEGTVYITDSTGQIKVINFAKTGNRSFVDCRKCKKYAKSTLKVESWGKALWSISSGFGDGVRNYRLVPFRTIAVDRTKIPYGTVIYVPGAKDQLIELPNGEKVLHDGYFFAGDTGGAIKENHIDTFTGIYQGNPFPSVIKSSAAKTFEAYVITDPEIVQQLTKIQTK